MKPKAATPAEYIAALEPERRAVVSKLRRTIKKNLQKGFSETMAYGALAYVVPHSIYPAGYHCDSKQPLPFINLASRKQYVSLYHMGLYEGSLLPWFKAEWPKQTDARLEIGGSCLRLQKFDQIPYDLIGELVRKMTPAAWVEAYTKAIKRR